MASDARGRRSYVSPALTPERLVVGRVGVARDGVQSVDLDPWAHAVQERRLDDGGEHGPLVDDLLNFLKDLLPDPDVGLVDLLAEEAVDLGVGAVDIAAAGDGVGFQTGGRVAERGAARVEHAVKPFLPVLRVVRGPLHQAEVGANAHRLQIADRGLSDSRAVDRLARELPGVETIRIPGFGKQLARTNGIVRRRR